MEAKREIATKLEQEETEIDALQGQVAKSSELSKKAVSIMDSIDGRLLRLESTILPIHGSTQKMSKIHENMDKAIAQLEVVMAYIDAAHAEEKNLTVAPTKAEDVDAYFAAVDRLREAYTFITVTARLSSADAVKSAQKALLYKASSNLEQLLRVWVQELSICNSAHLNILGKLLNEFDVDRKDLPEDLFPTRLLDNITKLLTYLASYEGDSDIHGASAPNTNFTKVIIEIRSKYLLDIFATVVKPDEKKNTDSGPYVKGTTTFIPYIKVLIFLFLTEWNFVTRVFPANAGGTLSTSRSSKMNSFKVLFESIILPSVSQYSTFTDAFLIKTRRNIVQNHEFSAVLALLDILNFIYLDDSNISLRMEALKQFGKKVVGIRSSFNEFTALTFKTLTEFLDEIRHSGNKNSQLPEDGIVHELSSNTLGFLKKLSEYTKISELLLRVLQNLPRWEEFFQPTSPQPDADDLYSKVCTALTSIKFADVPSDSNYPSIHKFSVEAINLLVNNLEAKARAYKKGIAGEKSSKSTLSAIFLLNNYHFILKALRSNSDFLQIVGKPIETKLASSMQEEMDVYMESWKPILSNLMDPSGAKLGKAALSKNERNAVKDLFKDFNEQFDEQYKQQKKYSIPDVDLRGQIVRSVKQVLIPLYTRVYERYKTVEFTKNPEKYLHYDVPTLEATIAKFFDPMSS